MEIKMKKSIEGINDKSYANEVLKQLNKRELIMFKWMAQSTVVHQNNSDEWRILGK